MVTGKPLLTVEQITNKVKELAADISSDYGGKDLLAIGMLRGAFMFFSDIVKYIQVPMELDFLIISSYIKTSSSGKIFTPI
jgi:hypoxanthine phosphoribosyltransferase